MGLTRAGVEGDRLLEPRARKRTVAACPGSHAGVLEELRLRDRLVRELSRLVVVATCLVASRERHGTLACAGEHLACARPDLVRTGCIGRGVVGGEVVRREHLDDLRIGWTECI